VCERSIQGDAAVSFLGGEICGACNAQMQSELRAAEDTAATQLAAARAAVTERAPASVDTPDMASQRGVTAAPAIFTPGAETRWCAGCERPMPGPGSYRVIAGEPYCPACVPFYSVLNLGAQPRHPTQGPAGAAPAANVCDCCGAALELGASLCEGFRFCTPCFTSDLELALGVARARHRRKLEALRSALDTGKTS
jgi:hypothetical protein